MGNTSNQNLLIKAREDHQQRNKRIRDAWQSNPPAGFCAAMADALTELAAIWREEATARMTPRADGTLERGAKGTAESLRDCATRVSGIAVAMRTHGLPGETPEQSAAIVSANLGNMGLSVNGDDSSPKDATLTTAGASTPESGAQAASLHAVGDQLDQAQMIGESSAAEKPTDADPKDESSQASIASASGTTSPSASFPSGSTPAIDADATGTQATPALVVQGAPPDFPPVAIDPAHVDIVGDFLRDMGRDPNGLANSTYAAAQSALVEMDTFKAMIGDNEPKEETLAQAASSIIEQVHAAKAQAAGFSPDPGPVTVTYDTSAISADTKEILEKAAGAFYMNSGGALDTTPIHGVKPFSMTWEFPIEGFTIGAADAPPAWAALPEVPVFELDSPMTLDSPGHTSVSQANLAGECPLKWKLRYRHGAPDAPSWALVGGKAVHSCIELIETSDVPLSNIARLWEERFTSAIFKTSNENPLFPKATWHASNKGKENEAWWNADGPEMVHHYLEWRAKWIAQGWELLRTAAGVPVVELEFLAFIGGVTVKGYIDSAWYHPGRNMIAIIDWKSGSTKPADYFQQATYRHALEPLLGEYEYLSQVQWLGAFWDARSGDLGPLVDLDARHPRAEVELRLSAPKRLDAAGLYMPNVNTGYGGCGSCSLRRSCPVGSRIGTGEVKL